MNGSVVMEQQDVYAAYGEAASGVGASGYAPPDTLVTVMLERCPTALSRAFGLLCTLGLVPASASSALAGEDAIRLALHFEAAPPERIDLLRRKLAQLVECLEVALPETSCRTEARSVLA